MKQEKKIIRKILHYQLKTMRLNVNLKSKCEIIK